MSYGSKYLVVNPGAMTADNDLCLVMRAGTNFGGITILSAQVDFDATGTADIILQNYGTSGTVAGGTVAGMSGGTATVFAAQTPQALTLTAANVFLDEGEYLYLKKHESAAANDPGVNWAVTIEYCDGIVTQG